MRAGFRSLRLDRIAALHRLSEHFQHEPGRTLADFLRHAGADTARLEVR